MRRDIKMVIRDPFANAYVTLMLKELIVPLKEEYVAIIVALSTIPL